MLALAENDTRFLKSFLDKKGITADKISDAIMQMRGSNKVDSRTAEEQYEALHRTDVCNGPTPQQDRD